MASSYVIYKNWYNAKQYNEELKSGSTEDYLQDKIFELIKNCFNGIYDTAQFNRKLYFNLKENWALLKKQDYDAVLINISNWLQKTDDRFDGENWTEKSSNTDKPQPTKKIIKVGENKNLITGETELKKINKILTSEVDLVFRENSNRFIPLNEVDFEVDDEDYDRIYYNTPNHNYDLYKENLALVIKEILLENGINDFKINKRVGEIKVYN